MINFHKDVSIFAKAYDLYKLFYLYLPSFPKTQRYTLGVRCENVILTIIEEVIIASGSSKERKLTILKEISAKLDVLKVLFRLCHDIKALDNKKYLAIEEKLQEIGRMLGGWIRSLK